jgi:hypothetical protein
VCVIGDTKRDKVIVGEDETCSALLRRATDAAPIRVAIPTVKIVVDDEKWLFALALDVVNVAGLNEKKES